MNQVLRQNSKMSVQNYFYKLMNNANFGYDCPDNAGNCTFAPVFDEIEELSYAKQFQNIFDQNSSEFASSELLEKQIEEKFSNKICSSINIMNISKLEKIIWSCKKEKSLTWSPRWKGPEKLNMTKIRKKIFSEKQMMKSAIWKLKQCLNLTKRPPAA